MNGCLTFFKRALLGAGVIFPLISLIMELKTNACAEALFDPIPTWTHIGLVLLMPASIFVPLVARRFPRTLWEPAGDFLHAAGFWASFLYVIALGPINFVALLAAPVLLVYAPFAIHPGEVLTYMLIVVPTLLGPLAAMLSWNVIFVRDRLKLRKRRRALCWIWGLAFGFVAIIAAEWPMIGFRPDVREALQLMREIDGDPSATLSRLRTPQREAVLLRMCYFGDEPKCFGPLMSLFRRAEVPYRRGENPSLEDLCMLYFHVTGTSISDVPPPRGCKGVQYPRLEWGKGYDEG